jgi:predicted XRE-type DNA-binding protein
MIELESKVRAELPDPVVMFKRELMREMRTRIRALFSTRSEAASYLGIGQPAVSHICTLTHGRYSVEWLITTATRLGLIVDCKVRAVPLPAAR